MANSTLQRLLDAGVQFGEMSKKQAESVARQLVKAGEIQKRDTERLVNDLVERGRETSDRLSDAIQREVSKQVSWLSERFDDLEDRFEDLASSLAERVGNSEKSATDAAPAPAEKKAPVKKKAPAKKTPATKKAPTKKKAAARKKAPARKAVGSSGVAAVATTRAERDAD